MRAALVLLAGALGGCGAAYEAPAREGLLHFEVELLDEGGTDALDPLDFEPIGADFRVRITAIGHDRQPLDWDGLAWLKVTPGEVLDDPPYVQLVDGVAEEVTLRALNPFDQVRIWVSDEGPDDDRDGVPDSPGSFAVGAAPKLHVRLPTITDVQTPRDQDLLGPDQDADTAGLEDSYVEIRGYDDALDPRQLIVTTVMTDGFFVTDYTEPDQPYASIFVFTFSRPDGIEVGQRLGALSGGVKEFIGYTELTFPSWRVESAGHDPGEPILLDPAIVCDDALMEEIEARPVRIEVAASDFTRRSECEAYDEHGQWPVLLDGQCGGRDARMTVVNRDTVPSFRFDGCEDSLPEAVEFGYIQGILRHVAPADPPWVIDVRDCNDLPPDVRPGDCEQLLLRPPSGPRKAPQYYYRDVPWCLGYPDHR